LAIVKPKLVNILIYTRLYPQADPGGDLALLLFFNQLSFCARAYHFYFLFYN